MYESNAHLAASTSEAVRLTCAAYEEAVETYVQATKDFRGYPGLRDALLDFAKTMPPYLPVLDIGCGGGRDARLLNSQGRRVVAGDISKAMLSCARRQTADHPSLTRLAYTQFNVLDLPFISAQFGGIWASGSLLHLPSEDLPRALSEILRTLAPGGVAAISMRAGKGEGWRDGGTLPGRRWFTLVDPQEFMAGMTRLGFNDVAVSLVGRPGWFIAYGRR